MTDLIAAHLRRLRGTRARTTINARAELLRRLDRDLPMGLTEANTEELMDWLAGPDDPERAWSWATKACYRAHVTEFFADVCDERHPELDFNPAVALPKIRVPAHLPKPVSDDEVRYALTHVRPRWLLAVLLAAYAGLRCCELATVRREHVTADYLTVVGKGGRERVIGTWPQVWEAVRGQPTGLLLNGMTARDISREGCRELARIGLTGPPSVTLHRFRHWCLTNVQRVTGDLRVTQEIAGHSSPATTAGYAAVTDEQRRMGIRALPTLAPEIC